MGIWPVTLKKKGLMIPNAPIGDAVRRIVEDGRMTYSDIAQAAGFVCKGKPDTSGLKRRVGLMAEHGGQVTQTMHRDNALRVIRAIHAAPMDFGI